MLHTQWTEFLRRMSISQLVWRKKKYYLIKGSLIVLILWFSWRWTRVSSRKSHIREQHHPLHMPKMLLSLVILSVLALIGVDWGRLEKAHGLFLQAVLNINDEAVLHITLQHRKENQKVSTLKYFGEDIARWTFKDHVGNRTRLSPWACAP